MSFCLWKCENQAKHFEMKNKAKVGFLLIKKMVTYSFIEHARLSFFIFAFWTVYETITQYMIVYTSISALTIGRWTCKAFHSIHSRWTLCIKKMQWKFSIKFWLNNIYTEKSAVKVQYYGKLLKKSIRKKLIRKFFYYFTNKPQR